MTLSPILTRIIVIGIAAFAVIGSSVKTWTRDDLATHLHTVQSLLAGPSERIDLALAKLTFDRIVSPTIDVESSLRQIDQMIGAIGNLAGPSPSTLDKLRAVRRYIYESGDWNDHRPYQYDLRAHPE